jgi:hypothetical protein
MASMLPDNRRPARHYYRWIVVALAAVVAIVCVVLALMGVGQ